MKRLVLAAQQVEDEPMGSMLDDPRIAAVLRDLHALSDRQSCSPSMRLFYLRRRLRGRLTGRPMNWDSPACRRFLRDKLVALDRDKCRLCYLLCRALDARRVVEVGTSFGVATIYLAAAVRENMDERGGAGVVIGTEIEARKVSEARKNLAKVGLLELVEIREGDVREILRDAGGDVDFVLMDIWAPLARPALDLLIPQFRPGAIVLCDNAERFRRDYRDYLDRVRDPEGGFQSITLPHDGGFEMSVWLPRR